MKPKVTAIYIGPPKAGSSWLYRCFKEHPEIAAANMDSTHYYTMFYHQGPKYYENLFTHAKKGQVKVEMCNDYLVSPFACERIKKDNPNVKIIVTLRNPIDRAFSHYWHGKAVNNWSYEMKFMFRNYFVYQSLLETGFYSLHMKKFLDAFPRENILVTLFDDLKANPHQYLKDIYSFIGVDEAFEPSVLNIRVNQARKKDTKAVLTLGKVGKALEKSFIGPLFKMVRKTGITGKVAMSFSDKKEHEKGVPQDLRQELLKICLPEIERIEKMFDLDLAHWKK